MYEELKTIIDHGQKIVFFGGAGVSTESGIPDFRSENGLYNAKKEYGYSPEYMLSEQCFLREPHIFFSYYKNTIAIKDAKPNKAHIALAKLEELGKLTAVVTQNIDGLHQLAGHKNVYELHGSVRSNTCVNCGSAYGIDYIFDEGNCVNGIPKCEECGNTVKPDVVLYGGLLDEVCMQKSIDAIVEADVLIIGGTSLVVYPAASFIQYFNGVKLVLINKSQTGIDNQADLVIRAAIGEVLGTCLNVE
ncbi:MAG: NAD-dependent protein deacylase [Clostridia bacterium]|nr:NAD-dependent protein deacylase [Clostridia bacterium]